MSSVLLVETLAMLQYDQLDRRPRRLRFSTRTLLALFVVVSIVLASWRPAMVAYHRHGLSSSWQRLHDPTLSSQQAENISAHQEHLMALLHYEYFRKGTISLAAVGPTQAEALYRSVYEFQEAHPDKGAVSFFDETADETEYATVYATFDDMLLWMEIFESHGVNADALLAPVDSIGRRGETE